MSEKQILVTRHAQNRIYFAACIKHCIPLTEEMVNYVNTMPLRVTQKPVTREKYFSKRLMECFAIDNLLVLDV